MRQNDVEVKMATYANPTMGIQQQIPVQFPYGNNNMLLNNSPYDNYMGRTGSQAIALNQFLKCRPVSSRDEAMAYQIDLDGSLWVFTDIGNNKIYTKQVNNDGTATFKTYILTEDEAPHSVEYVTRDEFAETMKKLMAALQPASSQGLVPAQNNKEVSKNTLLGF